MPKRGMEAVASKQQDMQRELRAKLKRKPVMQRKGEGKGEKPGVAVMIAIGKPKGDMEEMSSKEDKPFLREKLDASKGEGLSKADKIAALEEKIGYLKAELALLQDESEDEMDDDSEMDAEESEDEDEDEED